MFVRAVWRQRRLVDLRKGPRELGNPPTRETLALAGPGFEKMICGLFDRQ